MPYFTFNRLILNLYLLSHRISTFYSSLESLKHKEAKKFCVYFSTYALKGNLHNFSFSQTDPLGLDNFTNSFCWGKGFIKMYNLSWFEHFLFLLKNLIIYKKNSSTFLKNKYFSLYKIQSQSHYIVFNNFSSHILIMATAPGARSITV